MFSQPDPTIPVRRPRRRWAAGAASALAAALLAGGGTAVALQAHSAPPQAAQAPQPQADESLADLTSLDGLGADVAAADSGAAAAQEASVIQTAVPAASAAPSPSASASAKHPARAALRRVLAVVIRQDDSAQYGQHAQAVARAAANRYSVEFRRLPQKLRDDLWTLAGAAPAQEVADAQAIKAHALDGTYGAGIKKLAEAIQKAPAKPKASSSPSAPASPSGPASPAPSAPASPSPSPSAGS
ncbi:hypothetical protein [Sinomonas sp. RB5]